MNQRVQHMIQCSKTKIKLNVGGYNFTCSTETLTREGNTFFSCMFSGHFLLGPDSDGEYFVDRDGDLFYLILRHLRGYHILECIAQLSESDRNRLAMEAEFYGIQSMLKYFRRRPSALELRCISKLASYAPTDTGKPLISNNGCHTIALDLQSGCIFVSDSENHRIEIFEPDGTLRQTLGSKGSQDGEFNSPSGITLNSKGHLIVCDTNNSRVQIFDAHLNHIRTVGSRGGRAGRFLTPTSVAVDSYDLIYVTDSGNHRIQIFSSEGSLQRVIGAGYERQGFRNGGSEDGELNTPSGIAVNGHNGQIYVAEACNNRVQVFSNEGQFLFKFGTGGTTGASLNNPSSITLTDQGHLIVCDSGNHRLQIFDSNDGTFLNTINAPEVTRPCMIAYGPNNTLFVSDSKESTICGFELDAI